VTQSGMRQAGFAAARRILIAALLVGAAGLAFSILRQSYGRILDKRFSCTRLIDYEGEVLEPLSTEPYGLSKVAIGSETRNRRSDHLRELSNIARHAGRAKRVLD